MMSKRTYRPFTAEEDEYLALHSSSLSITEMSEVLGRLTSSVQKRVRWLDLPPSPRKYEAVNARRRGKTNRPVEQDAFCLKCGILKPSWEFLIINRKNKALRLSEHCIECRRKP